MTSRSKVTDPGGRNCATEIGLISITGLMRWTMEPAFFITQRMDL